MVKAQAQSIEPLLDDIESVRQMAIAAKADTPEFRSVLRNMISRIEEMCAIPQIPLSTYNVVVSLLSPLLDTENKLLLDRLQKQDQADDVRSLEKHIDARRDQLDTASHALHTLRTSIERICVLLNTPAIPDSSDEQLCKKLEEGLRTHLHDDELLRQEVEHLVQATQASVQSINTLLREITDDANDMAEIEQILEQKLPDDPKEAHALLQKTRKALLTTTRKLSNASSSLHHSMQSQVNSIENLSQRLKLAEDMANRDSLTGLANRRQLGQFMSSLEEGAVALLMVDIDNFKSINDRHGHLIGDKILTDIASLLATNVRTTDIASRFGGEEFCIVLPGATHDLAYTKAQSLKQSIANHAFDTDEGQIPITASIGVAVRRKGESIPRWTKRADAALYKAKQKGRNEVISAEMDEGC